MQRYDKLLWSIAYKISGDHAISSLEDNYADLCMAAVESVNGFHRKTGKNMDEMLEDKKFDGYTKTCLWHKKNSKGARISKRMPMLNKTHSMSTSPQDPTGEDPSTYAESAASRASDNRPCLYSKSVLQEFIESFTDTQKSILRAVTDDPGLVLGSGRLCVRRLSSTLGVSSYLINKEIDRMQKKFDDGTGLGEQDLV